MHVLARANELEATPTDSMKKIIRSSESAFEWSSSPSPRSFGTMEIIVRLLFEERGGRAAIAPTKLFAGPLDNESFLNLPPPRSTLAPLSSLGLNKETR